MKLALRQLAKSPGFAFVAILTLALGIGACTAMFSLVNAVLLKPLPFREPDRLVWIENVFGGGLSGRTSRADVFRAWREQSTSFESLAGYFAFFDYERKTMTDSGEPERLRHVGVSENFLPTLGVQPLHGRNFTAEECAWNGPRTALLSHAFWLRRFAGDPAVLGRTVTLNNNPTTIVGVLPPSFDFDAIFSPGSEVELLTPFPIAPETARWGNTLFGIGRLRPGVTAEQAQAELALVSEQLRATTLKDMGKFGAIVRPLGDALRGKFRSAFFVLTGAVACVLAIACVNLSNLLLARLNARRQEFAVRVALGARRRHLVQQALTESLLLAFAGSLVGVPLAVWATHALARMQSFGVPLLQNASVDPLALGVTVGLTTLAGIACGVLPALHLSRGQTLQNATHQRTAGRSSATARNTLVVAEVALACVLLVGAGLLFRSFSALLQVQLGFQPRHASAWRVDSPRSFKTQLEANQYYDGLVQRVSALPGVEAVGLSDTLPLGRNRTWGVAAQGITYPPGTRPSVYPRIVDRHYLQTMQIPLRAGRFFDERDDAKSEKSVIINESLARRLWPDQPDRDPIGQMLTQGGGTRIIGVVGNVRHGSLEETGGNEMYLNVRQTGDWNAMEMVVRSNRPTEALAPEIRAALTAHDPSLPSGDFYELDRLIDNAVAPRRLVTNLLGFFSTLALTLAALGLYGVIAYSVTQRTQEIGIRMAIGAQRSDVLRLILRGGLKLVALGIAAGLAGAFALTRLLQSQLFGVTAHDPLVFAGNAALLLAVATAACLLPALRATRVDPMKALRAD
jgi:putative ABC transport system permease protein